MKTRKIDSGYPARWKQEGEEVIYSDKKTRSWITVNDALDKTEFCARRIVFYSEGASLAWVKFSRYTAMHLLELQSEALVDAFISSVEEYQKDLG
jgi:hypothetical protein